MSGCNVVQEWCPCLASDSLLWHVWHTSLLCVMGLLSMYMGPTHSTVYSVHTHTGPLLHRGIKSVEWIKRKLEVDAEGLVQVKVSSKTKHVVHFNVKAGDVVIWQFATKKKDIAFGVLFESTEVATEEAPAREEVGGARE